LDQKLGLTAEGYSPRVVQMAVRQGSKSASFAEASQDLRELARVRISARHLERLVERVGGEWAQNRDADVAAFREDDLKRQYAQAPAVSAVMLDGGRVQTRADDRPPGVHDPGWKETKVACCLTLDSAASKEDPQPKPPKKFLDPPRVAKLVRQIKARGGTTAGGKGEDARGKKPSPGNAVRNGGTKRRKRRKARVRRLVRTTVATLADSEAFGWQVGAEVHRRGLDQAGRKACVCDGGRYNWSIFEMHLEAAGFIGILDFLHLLVYLYAAARAVMGKGAAQTPEAWALYERWLRLAWAGKASELLTELTRAARKLGAPPKGADEQDPRRVAADAVTYVNNNQERMDYPRYRKLGLPTSSAPVESLIKQFNRRVKGSEKFWLKGGVEAVLQVRAAYLSEDDRTDRYWSRPRPYRRAAGHGTLPRKKVA
jgi:hypothetical protein